MGVGNYLAFFVGSSSKSFNSGDTVLVKVGNCSATFIGSSSKSFNLGDTVLILDTAVAGNTWLRIMPFCSYSSD
jgi:hypothetical protein